MDQLKQQKKEQALQANIKSFVSVNVRVILLQIFIFYSSSPKADFLVRSHSVIKSKRKHVRGTHLMDEDMVSHSIIIMSLMCNKDSLNVANYHYSGYVSS